MTREQAVRGILTGIELAAQAKHDGVSILGVGEMGIGNTTTSSAVLSALTGASVEEVTGRGGGLTDAAFLKKKHVIEHALSLHAPDKNDPIDVLSKVGGFDLCAMTGVFLGAAIEHVPVVVDGFISIVAALCASRLASHAKAYFLGSHRSFEIGWRNRSWGSIPAWSSACASEREAAARLPSAWSKRRARSCAPWQPSRRPPLTTNT